MIFHDKQAAEAWFQETIESLKKGAKWDEIHKEGVKLDFSKLIPSYVDRKPYFEMLTLGPIQQELPDIQPSQAVMESHQGHAKAIFDHYIAEMLKPLDESKATNALAKL